MEEDKVMCCVCARNGKTNKLKTYQINFEEAIRFCEDDECTYPAGMDNSSWVLNRKFSELQVSKPSVIKKKSLPQRPHYASLKSTNYSYGLQKNISKSPVCTNPARVKSSLGMNQHHLKNGQNACLQSPRTSSTKTEKTHLVPNNKSGSQIQYPAFQQRPESVTQNNETPKLKRGNKSESIPNTTKSDAARQSIIGKSEKDCPSAMDQLRAFYPQWQNKDALCWMDVILCLLVHCKQVNKLKCGDPDSDPSIVCTLLKAYDQALSLLNKRSISNAAASPCDVDMFVTKSDNTKLVSQINLPSTLLFEEKVGTGCNDEDKSHVVSKSVNMSLQGDEVKTGAGLKLLKSDLVQLMLSHGDSEYSKAFDLLTNIREKIWHLLHPHLRCKKGKNDSPVFAIPLLTKNSKDLEQLLAIKYNFRFSCTKCGFQDDLLYEKVLPTFPNTTADFSMMEPKFLRPCFQCNAEGQLMTMVFERLPPVLMLHFQEGLHSNNFSGYDFRRHDQLYQVTGVIQYRNDPDHFIAWIRNPKEELWMECNDLKSPVCQFDQRSPSFPANQVHIMMWEAVSIEDGSRVTVQNGTRLVCTEDSLRSGHVDVSMKNSLMNESDLRSFVSEKGDFMHSVSGNGNNVIISTPSQSVSLHTPKTLKLTAMGEHQFQTGASKMNDRSQVNYQTPAKSMGKVVNVSLEHKLNVANIQNLAEIIKLQRRNVNKRVLPGAKNNLVHTPNSVHSNPESTTSTPPADKILEKTRNHVSFLRNMRNPRMSRVPNEPMRQQKVPRPVGLQGQGSLSFLSQILSNTKNKTSVSPVVKGKVFEGYRSKMSDATISFTSKNRTRSTSSEVDTESLTSRPNSPALSCHSDSVVIQKRKAELVSENITLPVLKRRRSQDTNFTSVPLPLHKKSVSLDAATTLVNKQLVSSKTVVNDSGLEVTNDNNQCSNSELFASASRNDCTFQETDILQNLYSALNIAMPAQTDDSKSPVKATGATQMDVENIPDISELDKFINSDDCDSNMGDNFDDFLSEL
ncbi:uncharacterized protein LOC110457335 [Mizuhopecten yessoensis]|uniref:SUMO-specific isopeptidase USPL1 n=1 Tax=Mizuhopecten yessoensis TaxID=6573 RepID=A0A210Q8Z9_MIZYE|nr:uncharacterized protein LOC110457335 [Mizuhopecten yessoensis]OWF45208.1 SUMO-specific isopeptidase USPL1 [Mizuhopecten yessoensis]